MFPFKPGRLSTRGCLFALLRVRRYTGITLGFRSQGVEQFVREGREECSFDGLSFVGPFGIRSFEGTRIMVNGSQSEGGNPPLCRALVSDCAACGRIRRHRKDSHCWVHNPSISLSLSLLS